ncbi:ELMO/CED-12 family protein [Cordyceps fumosorosea ARSEF 2679]|uniref:ELMO/CED-12 family protein n=1 Tax=Cordyceps fumosorosea (strain ARSEF 2679) TaxID=1081104 RepID=A0A162MZL9_CORFA|nr:ELMO/CED-12 family protein [Cordyceps fumosorosea ARSEF 2679]OAA73129.1 ELMO/CED-12 family protein [Cordyceps fumosorosea ARSEF 2679]
MDQADIPALLARLSSDEDAARKMAVFKLQSSINDPAFADVFISSGGLVILRRLIMSAGGNTLAYSLQSLSRLLEVDMGWDIFEGPSAGDLVERIVELIVTNPLVNILRGAMSILVALVSHSQSANEARGTPSSFGFRALRPAIAVFPQFFELVVQQLQSADHALCANALMLTNALIRDALSSSNTPEGTFEGTGEEWTKIIKRLHDLGLVKAVYKIMQSSTLQDLAHPVLEFQALSKLLLRRWRDVAVDVDRSEHRRTLKALHLASNPEKSPEVNGHSRDDSADGMKKEGRRHNPDKWRRLGFETESPAQEFEISGCLGMMDLSDYVRKFEDSYQKTLLEQSVKPAQERCPIAHASTTVTMILYDHFEVDMADMEDTKGYQNLEGKDYDQLFRPLLLQWSRLHTSALQAFFRIWKSTGAETDDFDKVGELVRILVEHVVGQSSRTRDVLEVEDDMAEFDVARLRELQMELLEQSFDDTWGEHLYQVRETLRQEALQFVKEQRVRCLLQGSWSMHPVAAAGPEQGSKIGEGGTEQQRWRFAKLSHNRRYLHYADFDKQTPQDPGLNSLTEKIDLNTISSVVSNVSASNNNNNGDDRASQSSDSTLQSPRAAPRKTPLTTTKITIYSYGGGDRGEYPILELWPVNHSLASEWLDGLLMLLNQTPITAETSKLVNLVSDYGLKIRLLNVRMDGALEGPPPGAGVVPGREGLDEDYFYEI